MIDAIEAFLSVAGMIALVIALAIAIRWFTTVHWAEWSLLT